MKPFRIAFVAVGCGSDEINKRHMEACERVPYVQPKRRGKLAVVGSGPSVAQHLEELKEWGGDIWAINGAAAYLAANGIKSTLLSVDPSPWATWMFNGVEKALFASCVHPMAFEYFAGNVEKFDLVEHSINGITGGCTTAARVPHLSVAVGYSDVTFYGCEGSFEDQDHVNENVGDPEQIVIKADGELYRTRPEYLMQSENIAECMHAFPTVFKEKCGGLLRAILHDPKWEIVAVSEKMKEKLEATNGACGLYDEKFNFERK